MQERQPHIDVSLPPFFLKINFKILKRKRESKVHAPWHGGPGRAPSILNKERRGRENGGEGGRGEGTGRGGAWRWKRPVPGQPPGSADTGSPKGGKYFILTSVAFRKALSQRQQASECFAHVECVHDSLVKEGYDAHFPDKKTGREKLSHLPWGRTVRKWQLRKGHVTAAPHHLSQPGEQQPQGHGHSHQSCPRV